jgi:hypothetical protein
VQDDRNPLNSSGDEEYGQKRQTDVRTLVSPLCGKFKLFLVRASDFMRCLREVHKMNAYYRGYVCLSVGLYISSPELLAGIRLKSVLAVYIKR